ncbi:hypothetical protein M407DRAFT_240462 [Tulasnella calospora MUT 4182]|uniref:Uncharacterized protein n=1 Tax=Tulasnella calospora MUT 4182 TaxID=1051891 RepID=A0A0C3QX53_9AGAM|nr:hypothetical protein M407DRAFT_240462 [Tulasnella calospora MUT 4182]
MAGYPRTNQTREGIINFWFGPDRPFNCSKGVIQKGETNTKCPRSKSSPKVEAGEKENPFLPQTLQPSA